MAQNIFTDVAATTLAAAISTTPAVGTSESWHVTSSAAPLPQPTSGQQYYATVGPSSDTNPEIVAVVGIVDATHVTVLRGQGTNAIVKTHASADPFTHTVAAGALNTIATVATTQSPLDGSTLIATDEYADDAVAVETTRAEAAEALLVTGGADVSLAGALGSTTNVEAIIRANAPNQFATMTGNLLGGGYLGKNFGQGVVGTDLATVGQVVPGQFPYVISGCVWTPDSATVNLNGSMTAGVIAINGVVLTVAAITAHAFTASKDTYVDFKDNGDGTANVTYTAVGNQALSPALAGSGTPLNTFRCAVIVSGATLAIAAASVYQGGLNTGVTALTTTVASGSNGSAISATTLSVAANSLPAAGQITVQTAATATPYAMLQYTGGGGTTTLTGVTVIAGTTSWTLATGAGVKTVLPLQGGTGSGGVLVYNTQPFPRFAGQGGSLAAFTTTSTAGAPGLPIITGGGGPVICPVTIPPGLNRNVKATATIPMLSSTAAAGTTLVAALYADNGVTSVGGLYVNTSVSGDGQGLQVSGIVNLAPGVYHFQLWVYQNAAGTLTAGITFVTTAIYVEFV